MDFGRRRKMRKTNVSIVLLIVAVFSFLPSVSANVLYESTFPTAAFSAYGKDGSKGVFQSLSALESNVQTSVSVSSDTKYAKFDFFPLDLTAEYLPVIYLSNSACVKVNRDGIAYASDGGTYFGAENWIFRWYEITVAYSGGKVQIFADDRCILNCVTVTSANGTASVRPAPDGKGDALMDNLSISENIEPKIVLTKYHKYGVPVEYSYNGAVTVGAAVYNAPSGLSLMLAVDAKDGNERLIDAVTVSSGNIAAGADSYIECGFSYPLSGIDDLTAYLWDSSLTPILSVKELECK